MGSFSSFGDKKTIQVAVISAAVTLVILLIVELWRRRMREGWGGGGGYGALSGLAFNNNPKYCFKNQYDPPEFEGYCTTIGRVVQ